MDKKTGMFVGTLAIWLLCLVHVVYIDWQTDIDIDGYFERAQVAAEASDMKMYMEKMKEGLTAWDYTYGHHALIFKSPYNDVELQYKAVENIIDRAKLIEQMDKSSMEYQSGMDDLRGTIRELKVEVGYFYYINSAGRPVFIYMICWIIFWMVAASYLLAEDL